MKILVEEMAAFPNIKVMAEHVASCKTKVEVEEVDWHSLLNESVTDLRIPQASCFFPFANKCIKSIDIEFYRKLKYLKKEKGELKK